MEFWLNCIFTQCLLTKFNKCKTFNYISTKVEYTVETQSFLLSRMNWGVAKPNAEGNWKDNQKETPAMKKMN